MSKQQEEDGVSWLLSKGESMEGYTLLQQNPVDYDTDDNLGLHLHLASVVSATGVDGDDEQDTDVFKIRYAYRGMPTSTKSRDFCVKMMSANRVYKKEDILKASKMPVNPGFGEGGARTYDLWLYKGGPRCGHFWERQVYLKEDQSKITVTKARRMLMEMPVEERRKAQWVANEPEVAKHPNDMPHKGFHPNNPNKPSDAR